MKIAGSMKTIETDTLIIGSGFYGTGLANYLHHQKKNFIIIGTYMDLWLHHTLDTMFLRSEIQTSALAHPENRFSLENFSRENKINLPSRIPVLLFRKYLLWCREQLNYKIISDFVVHLEIIDNQPGDDTIENNPNSKRLNKRKRFHATLSDQTKIIAENVIVATGAQDHLHTPDNFLQNKKTIHSYEIDKLTNISDQNILVAGSGQSSAEIIELMIQNKNRVSWYYRHKPRFINQPLYLPRTIFNLLNNSPDCIKKFPLNLRVALKKFSSLSTVTRNYKPLWKQTKTILSKNKCLTDFSEFDKIITATGFHYQVGQNKFFSTKIVNHIKKEKFYPQLNDHFESTVPGLYFIGAASEMKFGPIMRFIPGSYYTSKILSEYL